jgi:excisionase family DNA binding protein
MRQLAQEVFMETVESLIETGDVATVLKCGERRVQRLIANGDLPAVKLGPKIIRVSPQALQAFIQRGGAREATE